MIRDISFAFALALAILSTGHLDAQTFAFMVVDDVHYASEADYDWATIDAMQTAESTRVRKNVDRSKKTFLPFLGELRSRAENSPTKPFAIFSCGDLVHGGPGVRPEPHFRNFIRQFESVGMPIPLFNANGNHEMAEKGMEAAHDKEFLPFLSRQLGRPLDARHYGVTREHCHFILLDGLPPDRDGGDHEARIWALKDRQWAWLENELESNKDRDHIFVFSHATLWPLGDGDVLYGNDPGRHRALIDLLMKYNVRAVFAGHTHINSVVVYEQNARQLVQLIPNSHVSDPPPASPQTRMGRYTAEGVVPKVRRNWDEWGRDLIGRYQAGITHFESTPGAAGYFFVSVDGPEVTVRTHLGITGQVFREYRLLRDPATGATRFHATVPEGPGRK